MVKIQDMRRESLLIKSLDMLSAKDRKKLIVVSVFQVFLAGLDLLGVLGVGLLGALAINELESTLPSQKASEVLDLLHLEGFSFQGQILFISIGIIVLFVSKTLISIVFTRRILFFLARRGAKITGDLVAKVVSQPLLFIQERTSQETLFAVSLGVERVLLQVIASMVIWVSDFALLIVLGIGLVIIDPLMACSVFVVFVLVCVLLYKYMSERAHTLGKENAKLNVTSNEKIVELLSVYRELVARNRRSYYIRQITEVRYKIADTSAELGVMPFISKYVIESLVILGGVLISGIQFVLGDAKEAIGTLSIFLAAGIRIAPAILRLQQGSIMIKIGLGGSEKTLALFKSLSEASNLEDIDDTVQIIHEGFDPVLSMKNVHHIYPGRTSPSLSDICLDIKRGSSVALVGSSGAGKSTFVDMSLGILSPEKGSILISGLPPLDAISKWPGAIGFVPQDVVIISGTLRENITLGFPIREVSDELVKRALQLSQLADYVDSLPEGVDTQVGERGAKLSGGQRQRLGIARALLTHPKFLIFDEATSSLDGETESEITKAIANLHGTTTILMIAHRLSTIRNFEVIIYLSEGKVIASGSFDEVRKLVPEFNDQLVLMGL